MENDKIIKLLLNSNIEYDPSSCYTTVNNIIKLTPQEVKIDEQLSHNIKKYLKDDD